MPSTQTNHTTDPLFYIYSYHIIQFLHGCTEDELEKALGEMEALGQIWPMLVHLCAGESAIFNGNHMHAGVGGREKEGCPGVWEPAIRFHQYFVKQ